MVGATIVKVHRPGQGAKGRPRARPSAAPRAAHDNQVQADALGKLVRFVLLSGHRFDTVVVAPLTTVSPLAD